MKALAFLSAIFCSLQYVRIQHVFPEVRDAAGIYRSACLCGHGGGEPKEIVCIDRKEGINRTLRRRILRMAI
jgi:hypothetical protein